MCGSYVESRHLWSIRYPCRFGPRLLAELAPAETGFSASTLMAFLYDNLIATAVSMTVLLLLVTIQLRATRSSTAQTARQAALGHAQTLATWMEEDLESMGRNVDGVPFEDPTASPPRYATEDSPTGATLAELTFFLRTLAGDTTTVRYSVQETDSATIKGKQRPVYELTRWQDGTEDGGSAGDLGYFDVQFLDRDAARVPDPVNNTGEIRAIRVHFSVVLFAQNREVTIAEVHRMIVIPYAPAL